MALANVMCVRRELEAIDNYSYSTSSNDSNDDTDEDYEHTIEDYVNTISPDFLALSMLRGLPVPLLAHSIRILGRSDHEHKGFHCLVNSDELYKSLKYDIPIFRFSFCNRYDYDDDDNDDDAHYVFYNDDDNGDDDDDDDDEDNYLIGCL
mmetsp:Transcript_9398/g.9160  ORF Transcript_9398/g.9160 Transcript_9398/m.9160 type:complete len:150 (-) Transcript_9398:123-572(-)